MSRQRPAAGCREISFAVPCALEPGAQVALEDYARVVTAAAAAETFEQAPGEISGLHLCGVPGLVSPTAEKDVAAFARELSTASPQGGLGWS